MNSKDDRQKVYKLFLQSEFTLDGSEILNKVRTSNILDIQYARGSPCVWNGTTYYQYEYVTEYGYSS